MEQTVKKKAGKKAKTAASVETVERVLEQSEIELQKLQLNAIEATAISPKTPQQTRQDLMAKLNNQRQELDRQSALRQELAQKEQAALAEATIMQKMEVAHAAATVKVQVPVQPKNTKADELTHLAESKEKPVYTKGTMPLLSVRVINPINAFGHADQTIECFTSNSKFKAIELDLTTNLIKVTTRIDNVFFIPMSNVANFSNTPSVKSGGIFVHGQRQG